MQKSGRFKVAAGCPPDATGRRGLPAIMPTVLQRIDQLIECAPIVAEITFAFPRLTHPGDVMKVIRPNSIEAKASLGGWQHESLIVSRVLRNGISAPGVDGVGDFG